MFCKCNPISVQAGWGCWCVNFPKCDKEQDRAAIVSLNSVSIQSQFPLEYPLELINAGQMQPLIPKMSIYSIIIPIHRDVQPRAAALMMKGHLMELLCELLKPNETDFIMVLYQIFIRKCNLILKKCWILSQSCNSFSMELHRCVYKCGGGKKLLFLANIGSEVKLYYSTCKY